MRALYDLSLEGLVHLSAALHSLISQALAQGSSPDARALVALVSYLPCWPHLACLLLPQCSAAAGKAAASNVRLCRLRHTRRWRTQCRTGLRTMQCQQPAHKRLSAPPQCCRFRPAAPAASTQCID